MLKSRKRFAGWLFVVASLTILLSEMGCGTEDVARSNGIRSKKTSPTKQEVKSSEDLWESGTYRTGCVAFRWVREGVAEYWVRTWNWDIPEREALKLLDFYKRINGAKKTESTEVVTSQAFWRYGKFWVRYDLAKKTWQRPGVHGFDRLVFDGPRHFANLKKCLEDIKRMRGVNPSVKLK